jgi:hypothetical protein
MNKVWQKSGLEKSQFNLMRRRSSLGLNVLPNRLDVVARDDHQTILIGDEQVVALHPNATDDDREKERKSGRERENTQATGADGFV